MDPGNLSLTSTMAFAVANGVVGAFFCWRILRRFYHQKIAIYEQRTNQLLAVLDIMHNGRMEEDIDFKRFKEALESRVQTVSFSGNTFSGILRVRLVGAPKGSAIDNKSEG